MVRVRIKVSVSVIKGVRLGLVLRIVMYKLLEKVT